jgi:hypothetical protein
MGLQRLEYGQDGREKGRQVRVGVRRVMRLPRRGLKGARKTARVLTSDGATHVPASRLTRSPQRRLFRKEPLNKALFGYCGLVPLV